MKTQFIISPGQMAIVFNAMRTPKTMLQVSKETGIERANICRYVWHMKRTRDIYPLYRGLCPISKSRARFYTTNPVIAWESFIPYFMGVIENLSDEDTISLWEAIKQYVLSNYNPISVSVPKGLERTWNDIVKPTIDKMII